MTHWEQQYIEVTNKVKGVIDRAQNEKRNLTDEESQAIDRMFQEAERLYSQIEAARRAAAIAKVLDETPIAPSVIQRTEPTGKGAERSAFVSYVRRGVNGLTMEERALLAGTGGGSYLVPLELYNQIVKALNETVWVRKYARVMQISSNTDIPVVSARPTAAYVSENQSVVASDPTIAQKMLRAKKMVAEVKLSEELLADSAYDIESEIVSMIAESFASLENSKFVAGNGTSEPAGVVSSVTAGPAAASATSITGDNLIDLYFSLPAQYQQNAVFVMRSATLAHIVKLKDTNNRYLWMPPFGANQFNTILGRPVITDESMPAIGANNRSVIFFDPSYYVIGDRTNLEIQRLEELYIGNGLKAFRATRRNDGVFTVADAGRALVHPAS